MEQAEKAHFFFVEGMEAIQEDEPERAAALFREAIRLSVGMQQQVYARKFLAHMAFRSDARQQAIDHVERALELDQQHGFGEFEGDEADLRDLLFIYLDASYVERAGQLKSAHGRVEARNYLVERLTRLSHLPGTFLPLVQHEIARLSADVGDHEVALRYFQATLDAHVPDVLRRPGAPTMVQDAQEDARKKLAAAQAGEGVGRPSLSAPETVFVDASQALYAGKDELAIRLYQEALEAGLNRRDEVFAWAAICSAYLSLGRTQEGLKAGQKALELDAAGGETELAEPGIRWMLLQPLDLCWSGRYADEVLDRTGRKAAIEALESQLRLVAHLPGEHMPLTHIRIADLAFDGDDMRTAKEHYRLGTEAELPLTSGQMGSRIGQRYRQARLHAKSRWEVMKDGCWIATVAYGAESSEVARLRLFRDRTLAPRPFGRILMRVYYHTGPFVATLMRRHPALITPIRNCFLRPVLTLLPLQNKTG